MSERSQEPQDHSAGELELAGERPQDEQAAYLDQGDVDDLGTLTDTDVYEGELEAGVHDDTPNEARGENLELLTELELRGDETANPDVASEEGVPWIPPSDPPVIPSDDPQGIQVAAGFGTTSMDDPYDADHHGELLPEDDEMSSRVREALRADATTSALADAIRVITKGPRVILRGSVEDVDDSDNAVAVAQRVTGIVEVVDELEVRALG